MSGWKRRPPAEDRRGSSPHGEQVEVRSSPHHGQEGGPPHHGQEGSSPHRSQEQEESASPPGYRQVPSRPDPLHVQAPHATWASRPTAVKTAVAENWGLLSSSVAETDALVSARHGADLPEDEQEAARAKELVLRRKTVTASARAQEALL